MLTGTLVMAHQDTKHDDEFQDDAENAESSKIRIESQAEMLKRHTAEFATLTKEFERKKATIPKKDRSARAKLSEQHAIQGKQMRERHAIELKSATPSVEQPEESEEDGLFSRLANLAVNSNTDANPVIEESKSARRRRKKAERKKADAIAFSSALSNTNATTEEVSNQQSNDDQSNTTLSTGAKLSRAARRRLKRAQQEAESEKRIAEERAAMGPGERQIEMNALLEQIGKYQLRVHQIPADGNCMYSAILHQCRLSNASFEVEDSVSELRKATANYMLKNMPDFLPFIESAEGDADKFAAYCERIASETIWGGQVELRAVAELLDACIEVYAVGLPIVKMGNHSRPVLKVSYHRKYFGLGEHYNSLVPIAVNSSAES